MKVLVAKFAQETNAFSPVISTLDFFRTGVVCSGEDLFVEGINFRGIVSGFLGALKEYDCDVFGGMYMRAPSSGGKVEQEVVDYFVQDTQERICRLNPDIVLLSLHGATQGVACEDVCGYICKAVREAAGKKCIIAVGNDLHGNPTDLEMEQIDFLCCYQTYPHIDFYQTGYRAASLAIRRYLGEELYVATTATPMLVPASGYNTNEGAFGRLIARANSLVQNGTIVDFSIFQMQPWLDVSEAGSRVVVVAKDPETAKQYARSFAQEQFDGRKEYWPKLYSIEEAIQAAETNTTGEPVLLVDASDSVGAGAYGDSAAVVHKLLETGTTIRAASTVCDPEAVQKAIQIGVGNKGTFSFGGAFTPFVWGPVTVEATVMSIHEGTFEIEGVTARGRKRTMGISAVLRFGRIDVIVSTQGSGSGDTQLYRHFGIEPTFYDLVVVKANTSFRAAYAPITSQIYIADTPGPATANILSLPFSRIPEDFYPFREMNEYVVPESTLLSR